MCFEPRSFSIQWLKANEFQLDEDLFTVGRSIRQIRVSQWCGRANYPFIAELTSSPSWRASRYRHYLDWIAFNLSLDAIDRLLLLRHLSSWSAFNWTCNFSSVQNWSFFPYAIRNGLFMILYVYSRNRIHCFVHLSQCLLKATNQTNRSYLELHSRFRRYKTINHHNQRWLQITR